MSCLVWAALCTGVFFWIPEVVHEGFHGQSVGTQDRVLALFYALSSIASASSTLMAGWLLDTCGWKVPLICALSCHTVSLVTLPLVTTMETAIPIFLIFGMGNGMMNNLTQTVMAKLFGREHLGKISGISQGMITFGSALGPLLFGYFKDSIGTYTSVIRGSGIFPLLSLIAVMLCPKIKPRINYHNADTGNLQYELVQAPLNQTFD